MILLQGLLRYQVRTFNVAHRFCTHVAALPVEDWEEVAGLDPAAGWDPVGLDPVAGLETQVRLGGWGEVAFLVVYQVVVHRVHLVDQGAVG